MKLIAKKCLRKGFENYYDMYLCWSYKNRVYAVRVRPQFACDNKVLLANAEVIDNAEPLDKYV